MSSIRTGILLLFFIIATPVLGADLNTSGAPPNNSAYFTKIYVDGADADSNGLKLLLRASERHAEKYRFCVPVF